MRIIDAQGRLLGKINIIDFAVLCFLLTMIIGFAIGWQMFHKPYPHPPTVTLLESDYKAEKTAFQTQIADWSAKYSKLNEQKDNLLKKYKRLRKYFE